ncbi:hypothetical protein HZB60_12370 [candidate division KSB1 bacterium]|nr:hypothetical protein [candidate division KSB1 bacterium]
MNQNELLKPQTEVQNNTTGSAGEFRGPLTKEIAAEARRRVRSKAPELDRFGLDEALRVIKWWMNAGAVLSFADYKLNLHVLDGTVYNLRCGDDLHQVVENSIGDFADWSIGRDLFDGIEYLALELTRNNY